MGGTDLECDVPLRRDRGGRRRDGHENQYGNTTTHSRLPSVHDEVDPAVCDVIVAFDEPVVAGIRRANDVILDGVPNHVVVGPEERDDRLPEILGTSGVLVCPDDRVAGVVDG